MELGEQMVYTFVNEDIYAIVQGYLRLGNADFGLIWTVIATIVRDIFIPAGVSMAVTFYSLRLCSMITEQHSDIEAYIRELVHLVIVVTLINKSWDIAVKIITIGDAGIDVFINKITYSDGYAATLRKCYELLLGHRIEEGTSLGTVLRIWLADNGYPVGDSGTSLFITMLIPWIASKCAFIGAILATFSRVFDLLWRIALLPVGMSNTYGGLQSAGFRYVKSLLASALSGMVLLLIFKIAPHLKMIALSVGLNASPALILLIMAGVDIAMTLSAVSAVQKVKELLG